MRRIARAAAALALGVAAIASSVPVMALDKGDTLRIVIPYRPGGGYDAQGRLAAPYVEAALREAGLGGVNVIVENVTGGGGAIATAQIYATKADGRTVLFLDPESSIWQQREPSRSSRPSAGPRRLVNWRSCSTSCPIRHQMDAGRMLPT